MSLFKYLIAGGIGFGVAKLFGNNSKNTSGSKNTYGVFVRSDDFDKNDLQFYSFEDAQKMYNKITKAKKIKYKDIIEYDQAERKLFDQWESEGNIGKEGYPKLTDVSPIQKVILYINDDDIFEYGV